MDTSYTESLGLSPTVGYHTNGHRGRQTPPAAVLISLIATAGVCGTVFATGGNFLAAVAFIAALSVILLTVYRVEWSLYLLVGMVLLCDQYDIPGFEPLTSSLYYFKNLKEIPYLPNFPAGVMNPLELHLALLFFVWFITLAASRSRRVYHVPLWGAALLFFGFLVSAFVHGMQVGGDFLPALWEVRALVYLEILYFLVPQIITTREKTESLLWVCIAAISVKAFQAIYRFVRLHGSFWGLATLTNHEDPVFIATLLIFSLALWLFEVPSLQAKVLRWLTAPLLLGFYLGERRASYAGILASFGAFLVLLSAKERWVLLRILLPVFGALVLYCVAFWNSQGRWGSPVRMIKSGIMNDKQDAGEHYYSNLYRVFERYDLASTIRTSPVTGIGFGKKYEMPVPLANISFPLRDYIPHDEILWVLTKMGTVGYFAFWFFFSSVVFVTAWACSRLADPYLKCVCALIVAAVVNQMVVSYYDLQLTYYRNMVYLGTLMGLLPCILRGRRASGLPATVHSGG